MANLACQQRREKVLAFVYDDPAMVRAEVPLPFIDAGAEFVGIGDVFVDLKERGLLIEHPVQGVTNLRRLVLACYQKGSLLRSTGWS